MEGWQKLSASEGAGLPDPNTAPSATQAVPQLSIENKPAPGHHGPKGMSPRTTYSRVNTGAPPLPDAGAEDQKAQAPRGLESLPKLAHQEKTSMTATMQRRPSLHDLVKEAMEGTANKVNISLEAARIAGEPAEPVKTAEVQPQESVPTEYCEKLASALDYLSKQAGEGSLLGPGKGPNALPVLKAEASSKPIEPNSQGEGKTKIPEHPASAASGVAKDPATGLETNAKMQHKEQPADPMNGGKTASAQAPAAVVDELLKKNMDRLFGKTASAEPPAAPPAPAPADDILSRNLARLGIQKTAEDAINPAHITGGAAVPPEASASGEKVPSEPADVNSQKNLIGSNEAAINFTKGEAKRDPKSDAGKVWTEPALSAATDKTLQEAFAHTGAAGVKISHQLSKTAAAQAMLERMVEEVENSKNASKSGADKEGR